MKMPFKRVRMMAVSAAASTSDIERDFYQSWAQGDRYWWWICLILVDPLEIIVNDGDDNLYRMAVSVTSDGEVTFGEMTPVRIEFVDAATYARAEASIAAIAGIASARGTEKVAAKYESRAESRHNLEGDAMREKIAKLRAKLGLGEEVSDEEVLAAASEAIAEPVAPTEPVAEADPDPDPDPDDPDPDDPDDPEVNASVRVDPEALAQLQADAKAGREARDHQLNTQIEAEVMAAIKVGKIPPRSRESYIAQMKRDPKGTREFIAELAENVVPVQLRGGDAPTDAGLDTAGQAMLDEWLAARMPDVAARKREIQAGAVNSRVMTDA